LVVFLLFLLADISWIENRRWLEFIWGDFCSGAFQTASASKECAHFYFNGMTTGFAALFMLFAFERHRRRLLDAMLLLEAFSRGPRVKEHAYPSSPFIT
jgi:hypothetical protein